MSQLYILSLGGSLLAPNGIDGKFLKNFCSFVTTQTARGNRFIIIAGGGFLLNSKKANAPSDGIIAEIPDVNKPIVETPVVKPNAPSTETGLTNTQKELLAFQQD